MVVRVCECIIDLNIGCAEVEFFNKICTRNCLLGESVLPLLLDKVEGILCEGKIKTRVFKLSVIKLIENLADVKYKFNIKQLKRILNLMSPYTEFLENALNGMRTFLKYKIKNPENEKAKEYYEYIIRAVPHLE